MHLPQLGIIERVGPQRPTWTQTACIHPMHEYSTRKQSVEWKGESSESPFHVTSQSNTTAKRFANVQDDDEDDDRHCLRCTSYSHCHHSFCLLHLEKTENISMPLNKLK